MQRILVIGISGTGKTHLAGLLSQKLGLPVVNLDSIFWRANWQEEDQQVVAEKIESELVKEAWIIEGYIEPLSARRLERADIVIYLDYSGTAAFWGGIKRSFKHRNVPRPEMPSGNTDGLGYSFLKSLLKREERPEIEAAIDSSISKVVRLKNRRQAKQYVNLL